MTDNTLSPAAQAVLDAVGDCYKEDIPEDLDIIVAALRAVVDQVLPENTNPVGDDHDAARADQWARIRLRILSIATELETQ